MGLDLLDGVADVAPAILALVAILAVATVFADMMARRDISRVPPPPSPTSKWNLDQDDGSRLHPTSTFGAWGRTEGYLNSPRFLLPVEGGVLVADSGNDRLQVFSADGGHVRTIMGSQPGHPTGLATDGTHAWVADSSNCTVKKIVLGDGKVLARTGSYGEGAGQFSAPEGLALSRGALFVADEGNCRVAVLDAATLAWRGAFGSKGQGGADGGEGSCPRPLACRQPAWRLDGRGLPPADPRAQPRYLGSSRRSPQPALTCVQGEVSPPSMAAFHPQARASCSTRWASRPSTTATGSSCT